VISSKHVLSDNLFSRVKYVYKRDGFNHLIRSSVLYVIAMCFTSPFYNTFRSSETFQFQGNQYHYLFHPYCTTWKNERCAIVPIACEMVKKYQEQNKRILEVGNVISHIYHFNHDVLDKYEIVGDIINEDVVDFKPSKEYDLIFSIITLQHVGWNESPRDPKKILKAIENLRKILAPHGQIIIFHGLGENKQMDEFLKNGTLKFDKEFYLMKISNYRWKEVNWDDVKNLEYDYSTPTANGVVIGIIEK